MTSFFQLIAKEPFLALFLCLGIGHLIGRIKIRGFTLGTTASSLLVALIVSAVAFETAGIRFTIPDLVQTASLSLFLFAVGLRVGPQFVEGLRQEGFHLVLLTFLTATLNFLIVWGGSRYFELAPGFSAGMISGGYNVTAAMGVATRAVQDGAFKVPAGFTAEEVIANIAAGYSLTYIFSLLGIVFLITHLPGMFGINVVEAAKQSARKFGGSADPAPGTPQAFKHGMLSGDIRVFQLANPQLAGHPALEVFQRFDTPVLRITRHGESVPLKDNPPLETGDLKPATCSRSAGSSRSFYRIRPASVPKSRMRKRARLTSIRPRLSCRGRSFPARRCSSFMNACPHTESGSARFSGRGRSCRCSRAPGYACTMFCV
jgi:putative transport protein